MVGHKLFIKGWDYRDFYGSIAVKYGCSSEKEPPLPTGPGGHCFFSLRVEKGKETSLAVQLAAKVFDYCHV